MQIHALESPSDNYLWVLQEGRELWALDPVDAAPILTYCKANALSLSGILLTHRHGDHWRGTPSLLQHNPCAVYGPRGMPPDIAPFISQLLTNGQHITLGSHRLRVLFTPGHTLEHLVYFCNTTDVPFLLAGDTLFEAGCGRVFDSYPDSFTSLERLKQLPPCTRIYCGHNYAATNLAFAQAVEPNNHQLQHRIQAWQQQRLAGAAPCPTYLALELATNPFLRLDQPEVIKSAEMAQGATLATPYEIFYALRQWKNAYFVTI